MTNADNKTNPSPDKDEFREAIYNWGHNNGYVFVNSEVSDLINVIAAASRAPERVTVEELLKKLKKKFNVNGSSALVMLSAESFRYIKDNFPKGLIVVEGE